MANDELAQLTIDRTATAAAATPDSRPGAGRSPAPRSSPSGSAATA